MNKVLLSSLGIFLLSAEVISCMDTDRFHRLIGQYNKREITCQSLIDAYDEIDSKEVRQDALAMLDAQETPIAELRETAAYEAELFAQTFDTLIGMYKAGELSRAQLIQAYELFETDDDKIVGEQLLQVSLAKSIDELKQEEVRQGSRFSHGRQRGPIRAHSRQTVVPQGTHRDNLNRSVPNTPPATIAKKQPGRMQRQLSRIRARNQRRYLPQQNPPALSDQKKPLPKGSSKPEVSKQPVKEQVSRPALPQQTAKGSITNEQIDIVTILNQNLDQHDEQERLRQELIAEAHDGVQSQDSDDDESDSESEDEQSNVQESPRANPLEEMLAQAQSERNAKQVQTPDELKNKSLKKQRNVRFNLPSVNAEQTHKEHIEALRKQGQESHRQTAAPLERAPESRLSEEVTVHLTLSNRTPVFTKDAQVLNPVMTDLFNTSITVVDRETISQWGQQLAKLARTDEDRQRVLKPLLKALSQPQAPKNQIRLLIQPTVDEFVDRRKYQEIAG